MTSGNSDSHDPICFWLTLSPSYILTYSPNTKAFSLNNYNKISNNRFLLYLIHVGRLTLMSYNHCMDKQYFVRRLSIKARGLALHDCVDGKSDVHQQ